MGQVIQQGQVEEENLTKKPLRTGRVFLKAVALTNNSSVGPQQKYKTSSQLMCAQGRHTVSGIGTQWGTFHGSQTQASSGSLLTNASRETFTKKCSWAALKSHSRKGSRQRKAEESGYQSTYCTKAPQKVTAGCPSQLAHKMA